jgi:ABC-2 type transport system permease protein
VNGLLATLNRELRAYFLSPLAYAVLTFFLLVNGFVFWVIVSFLSNPRSQAGAPVELFFGQTVFFWLVLLFIAPAITMRLLSEERRSGTIEVLMTSPVTETQVVVGKFLAALVFYLFLWLPTLIYVAVVQHYGTVDWGPVAAAFLGIAGIGAVFVAVGVFASAVSRNQVVAASLAFAILILLFSFGLLENLVNAQWLKQAFSYLDLWSHMDDFSKGIVNTRRLVYCGSLTVFFLFLSTRALESNKWR